MTQSELAARVAATKGTVSAWATGKRRPPGSVVAYLRLYSAVREAMLK